MAYYVTHGIIQPLSYVIAVAVIAFSAVAGTVLPVAPQPQDLGEPLLPAADKNDR